MEVHGRQHDNPRDQLQRSSRDRIRHDRPSDASDVKGVKDVKDDELTAEKGERSEAKRDALELFSVVRFAGEAGAKAEAEGRLPVDPERAEQMERLAQAMREGRLLSPERVERAAERMLLG